MALYRRRCVIQASFMVSCLSHPSGLHRSLYLWNAASASEDTEEGGTTVAGAGPAAVGGVSASAGALQPSRHFVFYDVDPDSGKKGANTGTKRKAAGGGGKTKPAFDDEDD